MDTSHLLDLFLLFGCAGLAGFMDAVVGGGGMVQLPAVIAFLPGILGLPAASVPLSLCIGTNKMSSVVGTGLACWRYSRHIKIPYQDLFPMVVSAGCVSAVGAHFVGLIPRNIIEVIVFILMIAVIIMMLMDPLKSTKNQTLNESQFPIPSLKSRILWGSLVGFYDGFFGPGTGIILVLVLSKLFLWPFLNSTAAAKLVNLSTNIGALLYFSWHKQVSFEIGLAMALFNLLGAWMGAGFAIRSGSSKLRWFSLFVVGLLLAKIIWNWYF